MTRPRACRFHLGAKRCAGQIAGSVIAVCLGAVSLPSPAAAQQTRDTRMLITVIDQTNAVIPGATVTVTGTEPVKIGRASCRERVGISVEAGAAAGMKKEK